MKSVDTIKELLLNQARALEQRLNSIISEEMALCQAVAGADKYELAFLQDEIQPLSVINKNQVLIQLSEVKKSLDRLEKGRYGVCDKCDQQIDQERLRILAVATLCRECK